MHNKDLVADSLQKIKSVLETILERTRDCDDFDVLMQSQSGMMRLDAICMNLLTLGEMVKGLDKLTNGTYLPTYPEIYWAGVMHAG